MTFIVLVDYNEWNVNPPPTATSPTLFKVVVKRLQLTLQYHTKMAYGEISLLTGFKFLITSCTFHHFCVVSPLPFCNYLDTGMVLIRKIIQSIVDSFPKLLHAVAASASVWGSGSLQVLELTPASLWAPALGDPLPWDQQSYWISGSIHRPPFNHTERVSF